MVQYELTIQMLKLTHNCCILSHDQAQVTNSSLTRSRTFSSTDLYDRASERPWLQSDPGSPNYYRNRAPCGPPTELDCSRSDKSE